MSIAPPSSHPPTLPSPSLSMEQVRSLEQENQQLKAEIVSLKRQLLRFVHSSTPPPVVLALDARRTVDSGSSRSSTTGLSPNQCVMPVTKPAGASSTKRQTQNASTGSSVALSDLKLFELSTPVPGPDDKGLRGRLLTSMRDIFQAGKKGESGKEGMGPLQKASLKLEQCMALTGGPFVLTNLMKARECAATASTVSSGGPNCWAAKGRLNAQCGNCLSLVLSLEKVWGCQTSGGFFRSRKSSTSSTN